MGVIYQASLRTTRMTAVMGAGTSRSPAPRLWKSTQMKHQPLNL